MKENIYKYWGKADKEGNYHLLVYHCLDVAAVGKVWLEKSSRFVKKAMEVCGISREAFMQLFTFFLGIHDLGKLSSQFQGLRPEIVKKLTGVYSIVPYNTRHDQKGYEYWTFIASDYLLKSFRFSNKDCRFLRIFLEVFACISFGHHGVPPEGKMLPTKKLDIVWEWMDVMKSLFISDETLRELVEIANLPQEKGKIILKGVKIFSWQIAGAVSICDWIASGDKEFGYFSSKEVLQSYFLKSCEKAQKALKNTEIVPKKLCKDVGAKRLFPLFNDSLTPLQRFCNEVVVSRRPQLFILEDVTGSGKTEASLILASRIMAAGGGQGCFIALPTMATSNAMYDRMSEVYRSIYEDGQKPSLVLAHGSRHLSEKFSKSYVSNFENLLEKGESRKEDFLEEEIYCSQWLADSSKKSLLADIGVGTVDQVLLAGLPVRYQSLRAYGMTQKVLIVDEVHSFDAYMLRFLENLIKAQASFGGSVILLSATLPFKIRKIFCDAFAKGLQIEPPKLAKTPVFPLVTSLDAELFLEKEINSAEFANKDVLVEFRDSVVEIYKDVEEAYLQGKCVCWIRNTIVDVLEAYRELQSRGIIVELDIFHSRFALKNRFDIEQKVVNDFGKESREKQRKGRVLVASPVVEQSLDLDFDFLVSDLAPIDLLIQRAGRLHRHWRGERGQAILCCLIPEDVEIPQKDWFSAAFPRAQFVYKDAALLWRTKEILKKQQRIKIPSEARKLVESVYSEESDILVPETLVESEDLAWSTLITKKTLADFNRLSFKQGYSRASSYRWEEDESVSTRLSEPTITVYLCRWEDDKIKPLFEEEIHKWEFSSLSIRESLYPEIEYEAKKRVL